MQGLDVAGACALEPTGVTNIVGVGGVVRGCSHYALYGSEGCNPHSAR